MLMGISNAPSGVANDFERRVTRLLVEEILAAKEVVLNRAYLRTHNWHMARLEQLTFRDNLAVDYHDDHPGKAIIWNRVDHLDHELITAENTDHQIRSAIKNMMSRGVH